MEKDDLSKQSESKQRNTKLLHERIWAWSQKHPIPALILSLAIIIIAFATFTDALTKIKDFFYHPKQEPIIAQIKPPLGYSLPERCDASSLPKNIFKHQNSMKVLIAAFAGGTPETKRAGAELSLRIDEQLEKFVIDSLKFSSEDMETYRLECIIEGHDEAQDIMDLTGAYLVIWGNNYCFNDPTSAKYCPKATLTKRISDLRAFGGDVLMTNITDLDLPNLLAEEPYRLLCLVVGLHFHERDRHKEAERYFEKAAESLDMGQEGVGYLQYYIGFSNLHVSDYKGALNKFTAAQQEFEKSDKPAWLGACLNNIGMVWYYWGQYDRAIEYYQKGLTIAEDVGDRNGESRVLCNIGMVFHQRGNYDLAIGHFQRSLKLSEDMGNIQNQAYSLNNIGLVYHSMKQYDRAMEYYNRSLEIAEYISSKMIEAIALHNIAGVYDAWGQYLQALFYFEKSLKIKESIGARGAEPASLNGIGWVYTSLGQYDKAIESHRKSLRIAKDIGDRYAEASALNDIGEVHLSCGQYDSALVYKLRSSQILQEIGAKVVAQTVGESIEDLKAKIQDE